MNGIFYEMKEEEESAAAVTIILFRERNAL
jgi:hypothetical protein